jgi:hypothetical protein
MRSLGERGPVWWGDGAPDLNRHMARNSQPTSERIITTRFLIVGAEVNGRHRGKCMPVAGLSTSSRSRNSVNTEISFSVGASFLCNDANSAIVLGDHHGNLVHAAPAALAHLGDDVAPRHLSPWWQLYRTDVRSASGSIGTLAVPVRTVMERSSLYADLTDLSRSRRGG